MLSADLRNICRDRELVTPELHPSNDYYGNASILKRFVGIPEDNSTYCIIEHGPFFPTTHWDVDLQSPLPVFLRVNRAACKAIAPKTDKLVFAIGPTIAYAECHLDPATMEAEKIRLGRNLLIFPPHSTQHVEAQFDRAWLLEHIHSFARAYDSVTVCLYWKDIASASAYQAEGFECASAGHMYDPLFLNRLKSLLTLADGVISYSWCSAIGYSVGMGKPTMALPARGECYLASPQVIERDTVGGLSDPDNNAYKAKIYQLFSDLKEVTEAQRNAIDLMWGLSDIKSRKELSEIFTAAHDLHVSRSTLGLAAFPDALRQGRFYRQMGKPEMAMLVIEQALRMGRPWPDLLLEASLARADCGQIDQAQEQLIAFLQAFPALHDKARPLFVSGKQVYLTPKQLHTFFEEQGTKRPSHQDRSANQAPALVQKAESDPIAQEPEWIGVRMLDPLGRVFKSNGVYFKAIYPHAAEYVRQLFAKGIVTELVQSGLLVDFAQSRRQIPGYAFVLKSATGPFHTEAHHWCRSMLRDAALKYIDINELLLKYNLGLLDGHAANFIQGTHAEPLWCDLGSITHLKGRNRLGLEEFCAYLVYPLLLMSKSADLGRTARLLINDGGINAAEFSTLFGQTLRIDGDRQTILRQLREVIASITFPAAKTAWSDYNDASSLMAALEKFNKSNLVDQGNIDPQRESIRNHMVNRLIDASGAETVIDLGCNSGFFSLIAGRKGAFVYAADGDEMAVDTLYLHQKNMTPKAKLNVQIENALLYKGCNSADLVLSLALTHHLFLGQNFKFDYIAKILAARSRKALIVEFMPNGLGGTQPKPNPLPAAYTLENFVTALKLHFQSVEIIDYPMPSNHSKRILVYAKGRKATLIEHRETSACD